MVLAALTGGIATGKSYCLARFAALGVPVIDADRLARDAVAPGTPGLSAVAARFGSSILQPDGALDRAALARIVFSDARARADLEAIIHPDVYRRIRDWAVNLPPHTAVAIADIPLLFETGHEHDFDKVIVCACEPEEQVRRLVARDHLTDAEARARIAAQWPIEDKALRGDYVIRTDRAYADTDRQVRDVLNRLSAVR
jgi:dephospho-CoA kinase